VSAGMFAGEQKQGIKLKDRGRAPLLGDQLGGAGTAFEVPGGRGVTNQYMTPSARLSQISPRVAGPSGQ